MNLQSRINQHVKLRNLMNFRKLLPITALLFFMVGCNKSDSLFDASLVPESADLNKPYDDQVTSRSTLASYSQNPNIAPFREMFGNHFKYHATVEPWGYLPESVRDVFRSTYEQEKMLLDALGHDAWIDRKVLNGDISNAFGISMKSLDATIDGIDSGNLGILVQTLERQRNTLTLMTEEQALAQLIYDIILNVINELYPDGSVGFRADPCKLSDLISDIQTGAAIGGVVGKIVSAIFANDDNDATPVSVIMNIGGQTISVSWSIVGSAIGGILGGVVGLFNGDDCDCGPPLGISIVTPSAQSCQSSYQLYAWGAGDDAEFFDWIVTEGNSSTFFPGEPALLGTSVTQASPNVPLQVTVTALCAEAMGDPAAMAQNRISTPINLYEMPVNQVGNVTVVSNYNLQSGGDITVNVGNSSTFDVGSIGGAGWNNTYSVSLDRPYVGTVTQNPSGSFTINWTNTGISDIIFTATNTCSGLQNTLRITFVII